MSYLEKINSVEDLKKLKVSELPAYAEDVRQYICDTVRRQGGHLASNLGVVELTIALHYVFNCPKDKIVFDVGHQAYTHKIITGRRDSFYDLRSSNGVSGFPRRDESEYDSFSTGHSSTSLSAALGLARARDLAGGDENVIALIGDGALTGGMAYEALNDIGDSGKRMIIILNDNKMSISKNVGAMSEYLGKLRLSKKYSKVKRNIKNNLEVLPVIGDGIIRGLDKLKSAVKNAVIFNQIFESFGLSYYGPFDGHDIPLLIDIFSRTEFKKGPVIIHVVTEKGKGVGAAEKDPSKYHGLNPVVETEVSENYSSILSKKIVALAESNKKIVAITAAMQAGTGLKEFAEKFPDRYFDVGIAEQHAVTMAAGMAAGGLKPYFAVYSSFLQRAYDQVLHDVCIDSLPVTFLIDHAGAVEGDGATHQGIFDIAYLSSLPNMTILQPKDANELNLMLEFSVTFNAPLAIRYPKSAISVYENTEIFKELNWEVLKKSNNKDVFVFALGGDMIKIAYNLPDYVNIINVRVIKPLDYAMLDSILESGAKKLIILEDSILQGGLGTAVSAYVAEKSANASVFSFGYNNEFPKGYTRQEIYSLSGISVQNIIKTCGL